MGCTDCPDPRDDVRGSRSTTDVLQGSRGQVNPPAPQEGRSVPGIVGIHARTHPTFVEGCFACKVASVGVALPAHASTIGDGIGVASDLKLAHTERAKSDPERYVPATSRWI